HPAKSSHSGLPPVTQTLSRPENYSTANTAATAAPAASFSPSIRILPSGYIRIVYDPSGTRKKRSKELLGE
ncbi:MAG: hypothetical protein ABSE96_15330, partial [Terracidiphilus sp.]